MKITFINIVFMVAIVINKQSGILPLDEYTFRLNYGVWFKHIGKMSFTRAHWTHGFKINILHSDRIYLIKRYIRALQIRFSRTCDSCNAKYDLPANQSAAKYLYWGPEEDHDNRLQYLQEHQERKFFRVIIEEMESLVKIYEEYRQIIKTSFPTEDRRQTRSLIDVSGLGKSIFGLASDNDVQNLKRGFDQMTAFVEQNKVTTHAIIGNLTTMSELTNQRISTLKLSQDAMTGTVNRLILENDKIKVFTKHIWRAIAMDEFLMYASGVLQDVRADVNQLTFIRVAISELQSGKLPSYLVDPISLQNTIQDIANNLRTTNSNSQLLFTSAEQVYQNVKFHVSRNNDSLLIIILFPLEPRHHNLRIHQVHQLPLHVKSNDSTQYYSIIDNMPDLYIHDEVTDMFQTLSNTKLNQCDKIHVSGNTIYECNDNFRLKTTISPDCINSLYRAHSKDIKQFCKVSLIKPLQVQSEIINVGQDKYLVKDVDTLTVTCYRDKSNVIPGCKFCIINIQSKCGCQITDNYNMLQNTYTECGPDELRITTLFVANIAAIDAFRPQRAEVPIILANQMFDREYSDNIPPPSLDSLVKRFPNPQVVESDEQIRINLAKLSQNIRNGLNSYNSLADQNHYHSTEYSVTNHFTNWPNLILWIIIFVLIAVTGYQQYRIIIIVNILAHIPMSKAYKIYDLKPQCTPAEDVQTLLTLITHATTMIYSIGGVLYFLILVKIIYILAKRYSSNKFLRFIYSNLLSVDTHISMVIHDKDNKIQLYLDKVSSTMTNLALVNDSKIIKFDFNTVLPGLLYKITLTFDQRIKLHDGNMTFHIDNTAYISRTSKRILELMENGSVAALYAHTNRYVMRISNPTAIIVQRRKRVTFESMHAIFGPDNHPDFTPGNHPENYDNSREEQPIRHYGHIPAFSESRESI